MVPKSLAVEQLGGRPDEILKLGTRDVVHVFQLAPGFRKEVLEPYAVLLRFGPGPVGGHVD
jgi:hypothetical protein